MTQFTRNGVPDVLRRGRWVGSPEGKGQGAGAPPLKRCPPIILPVFIFVFACDFTIFQSLIFGEYMGALPLALLTATIFGLLIFTHRPSAHIIKKTAMIAVLSVLPAISFVQSLSIMFWWGGLVSMMCLTSGWSLDRMFSFLVRLPWAWIEPLIRQEPWNLETVKKSQNAFIRNWGLAIFLGLTFAFLFTMVNPIFEGWAVAIFSNFQVTFFRVVLWVWFSFFGIILVASYLIEIPLRSDKIKAQPILGPIPVRNSLIIFNIIFAIQLITDSAVLLFGFELPRDMTLANFAHRGAYPLVFTAIFAFVFMLISRPHRRFPLIKVLLALWVGQNILLVCSAAYRLGVYVDFYGWTYLRLHSFIWMGFVVFALGLIAYDLYKRQADGWVIRYCKVCGWGILYTACFINFSDIIVRQNLARYDVGKRTDFAYIYEINTDIRRDYNIIDQHHNRYSRFSEAPKTWREWDFRVWYVTRGLKAD